MTLDQEALAREEEKADRVLRRATRALRPPPKLRLSEWADRNFRLSEESAAQAGPWRTLPYQVGIMDAFTDPSVTFVVLMKSSRIGATKIFNAVVAYHIDQDPTPVMVVQPTVEDAQGYSKEEIAPMVRDVPALQGKVAESRTRDSSNTILHKVFPGGSFSVVGANSARGFRRVSRRVVLFDETDAYPPSAGAEGDQIKLGIKRTEFYWNRKIGLASSPTLAGASRIESWFLQGDQRRFYVPCPSCGHMDILVFRRPGKHEEGGRGHYMAWPKGKPAEAFFVCSRSGCTIEHHQKREMVAAGEWRSEAPFRGIASFHVWAAYSFSPNATWGQIAEEFVEADKAKDVEKLKTFVNTTLGEVWQEQGEAPDWEVLHRRRETYQLGVVPAGVEVLTAGVDVQADRLVYEVVGWGSNKESWSIEAGVLPGTTSTVDAPVWRDLEAMLNRTWPSADGAVGWPLRMLAIDSGWNTNVVYSWARKYPRNRVMATKGVATQQMLVGVPTKVDVTERGKRVARGYRVWPVGVNVAKSELYGWLRLEPAPDAPLPQGWCHFPQYDGPYFKELTAEHLVMVKDRKGFSHYEWQLQPGRENHFLDCRILARVAASVAGLDRARARPAPPAAAAAPSPPAAQAAAAQPPGAPGPRRQPQPPPRRPGGWLGGGGRGGNWLGRRR